MSEQFVYDLSPRYEFAYVKEVDNEVKIWGAYCTYKRYSWDNTGNWRLKDKVLLFSGTVGKPFRYTFGVAPNRLQSYGNKYRGNGYTRIMNPDLLVLLDKYPFIHENVSKKLLWHMLRN